MNTLSKTKQTCLVRFATMTSHNEHRNFDNHENVRTTSIFLHYFQFRKYPLQNENATSKHSKKVSNQTDVNIEFTEPVNSTDIQFHKHYSVKVDYNWCNYPNAYSYHQFLKFQFPREYKMNIDFSRYFWYNEVYDKLITPWNDREKSEKTDDSIRKASRNVIRLK